MTHSVNKAVTAHFYEIVDDILAADPVAVPVPKPVADFERIMVFEVMGFADALYVARLEREDVVKNIHLFCAVYLFTAYSTQSNSPSSNSSASLWLSSSS